MRNVLVVVAVVAAACASTASASVLFSDDFNDGTVMDGAWEQNTQSPGTYTYVTPTAVADPDPSGTHGNVFKHPALASVPGQTSTVSVFHRITPEAGMTKLIVSADVYTGNSSVRSYVGFSDVVGTALTANAQLNRMGFGSSASYSYYYGSTVTVGPPGYGWHNMSVVFDLENKQVEFKFDGATVGGPIDKATITKFPDTIFLGYQNGSTNAMYWDNVVVEQLPEPTSLVLLALGGLMLRRRTA